MTPLTARGVEKRAVLQVLSVSAALALVPAGCSLAFVNGPPANHQKMAYFDCSSSRVLPTVDLVLAGAAAVDAIGGGAGVSGLPSNRANLVMFGAEAAVFAASAIYGYGQTAECREAQIDRVKRAAQTPTFGYPPGAGGPYAPVPGLPAPGPPPPYDPWVAPPAARAPGPPILSPVGPLPAPSSPASAPGSTSTSGNGVQ